MQKILVIFISISLALIGCASSTGPGSIQADIIDGATAIDTYISGLQGQQADSASDAQAITDTSEQITDSIDTAIGQLSVGAEADGEFARIVNKIQERESVDFVETNDSDIGKGSADTQTKESAE